MGKVVTISNKSFVDALKHIASLPTKYKNKYPYNLGYNDGTKSGQLGVYSFDCWNLVKTVINRMCLNNGVWYDSTKGQYQKDLSVTGDCNGQTLLNKCANKGKDFKYLAYPGTYLYMPGHAGTYIGDVVIGGKTYNVIESTGAWTKNVLYSYVDVFGGRYRYKGGARNGSWTDWGLLPWVTYDGTVKPTPSEDVTTQKYKYGGVYYDKVFNPTYYANKYADLKKAFGTDANALFNHFCTYGMKERRQAISDFNVDVYKANNPDLVKAFGENYPEYYKHYCVYGYKENRKHY